MASDEMVSADQTQQMLPGTVNLVGSPCCQPCGGANERPICSGGMPLPAFGLAVAGGGVMLYAGGAVVGWPGAAGAVAGGCIWSWGCPCGAGAVVPWAAGSWDVA